MHKYYYQIQTPEAENQSVQNVQVGSHSIQFRFRWAYVSEEQFNIIARDLVRRASNDPLDNNGEYDSTYNWLTYYYDLRNTNLEEWLATNPILPRSLTNIPQARCIAILQLRIAEAVTLMTPVNQYLDALKWQVLVTCPDTYDTVALVQPGGWYRNNDSLYAFRFMSALEYIGKNDLDKAYVEFEVYDE